MPPAVTSAQLSNIASNLTPVITLFNQLDESFGPPFLCTISSTTQSLIDILQVINYLSVAKELY
jgi:hypothetical protein